MNNLQLSKFSIINSIIIILWITLLWYYLITYTRLIIFCIILLIILIYRIIVYKLENSSFILTNAELLKYILIINKYRNPILLILIKLDILLYDLIIYYNNKVLNFIIYCICIIIINPVKIFYYKMYKVLWIWKEGKLKNIVLNRMLGLILSVLIFANIIMYIKNTYNLNIIMIIYLYCLVISILCEVIETRENKWLNIFLVNNITTQSIILSRLEVNLLSIVLTKSNINELELNCKYNKYKIDKFQIGYTYYIIDSLKYFTNKLNYWTYIDLSSSLRSYFIARIPEYIFFEYYKWNVSCIDYLKVDINKSNIFILKRIYEYDYQVFKVLLFLYWDLENYLEGQDYVKNSLIVDSIDLVFFNIMFNKPTKSEIVFLDKIKYKDINKFWNGNWFDDILKYDLFNEIDKLKFHEFKLNSKYNDLPGYKLYKKYNDFIGVSDINLLREIQTMDDSNPINTLYYDSCIKDWYKEWRSEINQDLLLKYKKKISILDIELNSLLVFLSEF